MYLLIPLNLFCLYFLDDEEMAGMVAGNENDATLFDLTVQINLFCKRTKADHILEITKEMSFCHKLKFSNPFIFATWWCKPLKFQANAY